MLPLFYGYCVFHITEYLYSLILKLCVNEHQLYGFCASDVYIVSVCTHCIGSDCLEVNSRTPDARNFIFTLFFFFNTGGYTH